MPTNTTTVLKRSVVSDASGNLWDLANPNIIGIASASGGTQTQLQGLGAGGVTITVAFSTASSAFNAS